MRNAAKFLREICYLPEKKGKVILPNFQVMMIVFAEKRGEKMAAKRREISRNFSLFLAVSPRNRKLNVGFLPGARNLFFVSLR